MNLEGFKITHIGGVPIGAGINRPRNSQTKGGTFADRKQRRIEEMKRQIHIQAAEGGKDSELFVQDLAQAFSKLAYNMNWTVD